MSRFGTEGTFVYAPGDTLTNGTVLGLSPQDMFQYPFDTRILSNSIKYRTLSGESYEYEDWKKEAYTFNFTDLRESKRQELFEMIASAPTIFSFASPPGSDWGTFRADRDSWSDTETSHERYDVSFTIEKV